MIVWMQVRWYYVLVAGVVTPPCALANAFGTALVDQVIILIYCSYAIFKLHQSPAPTWCWDSENNPSRHEAYLN